jgi:hypothetical protein
VNTNPGGWNQRVLSALVLILAMAFVGHWAYTLLRPVGAIRSLRSGDGARHLSSASPAALVDQGEYRHRAKNTTLFSPPVLCKM